MDSNLNKSRIGQGDNGQLSPVEVFGNKLIVVKWETDEAEIVSFFANKPAEDRPRAFERALKVGVVASSIVGTAERIDYVQKEFNSLQRIIER